MEKLKIEYILLIIFMIIGLTGVVMVSGKKEPIHGMIEKHKNEKDIMQKEIDSLQSIIDNSGS